MNNPAWQRDELILALDLYLNSNYNKLSSRNSDVIKLSKILNQLPIFSKEQRTNTFRNPDGVYMKLGNLLAIDPNDSRKGLPGYGKLDEIVFHEFVNNRHKLSLIANSIKISVSNGEILSQLESLNIEQDYEEINAKEGKVIYRLHKIRERNPALIKKKKMQVLRKTGNLLCEVCSFNFQSVYGKLGEGFIECHHTKPVSQMTLEDITRMEDLALVCSNCHRMLYRQLCITIEKMKDIYFQNSNKLI